MSAVIEHVIDESTLRIPGSETDVSVIVPVSERLSSPEALDSLMREYGAPISDRGWSCEFIVVLEPWFRVLATRLAGMADGAVPVRILVAGQSAGETGLVKLALEYCRGRIVVTLPAYRRVEASALPQLIDRVEVGADIATARRWPRNDAWINRWQTRAFHALLRWLNAGVFRDVACGVRAVRRDVLEGVALYGELHRFLPLVASREGYRVEEIDAPQHAADVPTRVYSPGVYLRRLLDVLGLFFLLRFTYKPLRFFGLAGTLLAGAGAVLLGLLFVQRLGGQGIADRPLLLLGVLLVVLGAQAVALGLVGEIIVHLGANARKPYRLARSRAPTP